MKEIKRIKHLEKEILDMQATGKTYREIAEHFGYTKLQVKNFVKMYRRRIKNENVARIPKEHFDPNCKTPETVEECKKEIERLQMENDLLRSFLQAAGRR